MRILAIDVGERRIGVAAADDRTRIAIPIDTMTVAGDPVEAIARLVQEQQADALVVGMPFSLSGAVGPQADRVQALVDALADRLTLPVHTWDERLTSVQAGRRPAEGKRRRRGGRRAPVGSRDAAAAAIILQAYLDSRRPSD